MAFSLATYLPHFQFFKISTHFYPLWFPFLIPYFLQSRTTLTDKISTLSPYILYHIPQSYIKDSQSNTKVFMCNDFLVVKQFSALF